MLSAPLLTMDSNSFNLGLNGGQSSSKSPAALLSEQHALDDSHKVTVEDVIDEEDLKHPPPSAMLKGGLPDATAATVPSVPSVAKPFAPNSSALDVQSEELFPALGSGPKSKAPATVPTTWGAKKSGAALTATNGFAAGPQTAGKPSYSTSCRSST